MRDCVLGVFSVKAGWLTQRTATFILYPNLCGTQELCRERRGFYWSPSFTLLHSDSLIALHMGDRTNLFLGCLGTFSIVIVPVIEAKSGENNFGPDSLQQSIINIATYIFIVMFSAIIICSIMYGAIVFLKYTLLLD